MKAVGIATNTLCTQLNDERTPPSVERVRGQRYWTGAEIRTRVWFLVEAYVITEEPRLISFVTTFLDEIQGFLDRYESAEWKRVYVRIRAPLSEGYGMLFEELQEVYFGAEGSLIFHLANGLIVMEQAAAEPSTAPKQLAFHKNFTKGRSGSLLY